MNSLTLKPSHMPTSQLSAAIHAKCPKCRRGDMFSNNSYNLFSQKMNTNCPHCGFTFEPEPGYFYVAMFVSYAFNVAQMVTMAVALYVLSGSRNPWVYVGALLGVSVLLSPFNFRYSRVVLLYWLTPGLHYDPNRDRDDYVNPNYKPE
ncbi:DUF983 domain-containing protein [Mucilaginibacter sp. dw_454]|uniref:DUF983 domain-containing protein n=1 Tax=Mucilaginibacter sp. dw_454 TaxID=2720079 RepID=UPI001BD62B20|nr:DUF983 domain-containing protein [Mucilaginibacter sp. dw_454]